jgi:hypothetical protein
MSPRRGPNCSTPSTPDQALGRRGEMSFELTSLSRDKSNIMVEDLRDFAGIRIAARFGGNPVAYRASYWRRL